MRAAFVALLAALPAFVTAATNDGIVLAVSPHCGAATGNATDINEGVPAIATFKTIVAFGVRVPLSHRTWIIGGSPCWSDVGLLHFRGKVRRDDAQPCGAQWDEPESWWTDDERSGVD